MGSSADDAGVFPAPKEKAGRFVAPVENEAALMQRVREGDGKAFDSLYRDYAWVVAAFFRRNGLGCDAIDDLTQEAFSRVWEHRGRFRSGTPIRAYLLGFARNVLHERQADAARRVVVRREPPPGSSGTADIDPETHAHRQELAERIRGHIAGLPTKQRQALELVYLAQMSVVEAAKVMNCSTEALRRNLCEARRRLETTLFPLANSPNPCERTC